MLRFSKANAKISALQTVSSIAKYLENKSVYSLDILSGYSCPYANECLSKAVVNDGSRHIQDGPNTKFRCFSATQELVYPAVYNQRKANFDLLRAQNQTGMYNLIMDSLPNDIGICRIHVGGDFFNKYYMRAWSYVAVAKPDVLFYAYTKSLPFWAESKLWYNSLPNFVLTASYGGRRDDLIETYNLRTAKVVFHPSETTLEIDHNDSCAANPENRHTNFALLLHGVQPGKTEASKALSILRREKIQHSYGRK